MHEDTVLIYEYEYKIHTKRIGAYQIYQIISNLLDYTKHIYKYGMTPLFLENIITLLFVIVKI